MGREVRKVPADWQHPKEGDRYTPLSDGYTKARDDFMAKVAADGLQEALDYWGIAPNPTKRPSEDDPFPDEDIPFATNRGKF